MARARSDRRAPNIAELRWEDLTDGDPDDIRAGELHEASRYADADLSSQDLTDTRFTECELLGLRADETQLMGARFVHTRFERLAAASLKVARTTWQDARIATSRLGAVELYEAGLRSVVISDSRLSWVNLRAASLRDVVFEGCEIAELDLTDARAERVAFRDCRAESIRFNHARLRQVDLRGLDMTRVDGVDGMAGSIISTAQSAYLAELLATQLGIAIDDA